MYDPPLDLQSVVRLRLNEFGLELNGKFYRELWTMSQLLKDRLEIVMNGAKTL
jgi:hypothetical protein